MTHDAFVNLLSNVIAAAIFSAIGIVLFIAAFMIFDRITPGSLWKELIEDRNQALGNLMGAVAIALAIIIAASVH